MPVALFGHNVGWTEVVVILCIVILLFGAKRIPSLFRQLGRSIGEFQKGLQSKSKNSDP